MLAELTARLRDRENLTGDEMTQAVLAIVSGNSSDDLIGPFLLALREKGETVDELAGAAAALRAQMRPIRSAHPNLLDTCGTGGDGSQTFNISTATALVTAAAGQPVAKHGNRSITSRSGSADVLRTLGVNVEASCGQVESCLEQLGICFCYAPLMHPSMRNVADVRRSLGVPTIFNLLGPLCNPARAPFQLLGVGRPEVRGIMAAALQQLGTRHAVVVNGSDGLDECTLAGPTSVSEVDVATVRERNWHPEDFGLTRRSLDGLQVDGPQQSAAVIRNILDGEHGGPRDIVLMNAAAALWTTRMEDDPVAARQRAAAAIDSGTARSLLARLVELSHQPAGP